jgi:hypothetical protein
MTTALLIIHGLLAVALLGALSHQAAAVLLPAARPAGSLIGRFRAVPAPGYANAIVVLYVLTALLGAIIYGEYRISVRIVLEELQMRAANGSFELKEHFAAIALGMLPAYWASWRQPAPDPGAALARKMLTTLLAFVVWWNFLVGHILNNVRGFGS